MSPNISASLSAFWTHRMPTSRAMASSQSLNLNLLAPPWVMFLRYSQSRRTALGNRQNSMEGALNQGIAMGMVRGVVAITVSSEKEERGALSCHMSYRILRHRGREPPRGCVLHGLTHVARPRSGFRLVKVTPDQGRFRFFSNQRSFAVAHQGYPPWSGPSCAIKLSNTTDCRRIPTTPAIGVICGDSACRWRRSRGFPPGWPMRRTNPADFSGGVDVARA